MANQNIALWTEAEDVVLRKLTREGYSASRIGARMGRSRGSVIGRRNRLGMSCKRLTTYSAKKPRAPMPVRNGGTVLHKDKARYNAEREIVARAMVARAIAMGELPKREWRDFPSSPSDRPIVAMLDLQHGQCRYIPGDPRISPQFCGAPAITDAKGNPKPYCALHNARCHREGTTHVD